MNKKILVFIMFVVIIVILLWLFGIGRKRSDVVLNSYHVSEDGKKVTLNVGVSSSAGYIRTLHIKQGGDNKYITFYSTFGLNNKLGAKNEFEIELNPSCEEIFFYNGNGGYQLVLKKNSQSEWQKSNDFESKKKNSDFQDNEQKEYYFCGKVVESNLNYIIVEPNEEEEIYNSADKISIGLGEYNDCLYEVGTNVKITYNGMVKETYPAQVEAIDIEINS